MYLDRYISNRPFILYRQGILIRIGIHCIFVFKKNTGIQFKSLKNNNFLLIKMHFGLLFSPPQQASVSIENY